MLIFDMSFRVKELYMAVMVMLVDDEVEWK